MQQHEYTVIPAPARGEKTRGARTGAERFAHALTVEINRMAAAGWEYIRAETLPCEERSGLTSRTTVYHNVLVFRRRLPSLAAVQEPEAAPRAAPVMTPALLAESPAGAPAPESRPALPADLDDVGAAAATPEPPEPGPAPAFVQRPPLAARPDAQGPEPTNGTRLGPASR
ncbi:MAG TPA: DUF4177 domain-containing protein [Paracoccus solventivorans]|uniref:DUF4177 domain-containing protein n=1 Tax=Paracoccus solventivorans TaxID=53463 RepID=A0A832QUZ8_9RHOB|nr:DUF4177 domain-containing protein [Paracoccus solventivorans]HHW32792.1 DUF4177 domain-containing protein [Paracoccus solventivorans]